MNRHLSTLVLTAIIVFLSGNAWAGVPPKIEEAVLADYQPAIWHKGLETAYVEPDPNNLRSFVVMENGGVPVERARFFITWADYDYRGVVIHLAKNDKVTTRRGRPYAYLQRGDVMAVAGIKYFNSTVYLKLISAKVYIPRNKALDKRHSRVTVMLGFKFPKNVFKEDDAESVIKTLTEWLKPFPNLQAAEAYAGGLKDENAYIAEETKEAGKADTASKTGNPAAVVPAEAKGSTAEDAKMKNLEDKIERARRELDEAEEELKSMKKDK